MLLDLVLNISLLLDDLIITLKISCAPNYSVAGSGITY